MQNLRKVLIIDDSKLARLTLKKILHDYDLTVLEANSVLDGLTILNTENIDAIFIDIIMPDYNGFDCLKLIKSNLKLSNIPCSMYSSDLSIKSQKLAAESGAQAYLFKPANTDDINHVLKVLDNNSISEKLTNPTEKTKGNKEKVTKILSALDNRTKNLARVIVHEKQKNEKTQKTLERKLHNIIKHNDIIKEETAIKEEKEYEKEYNEIKKEIYRLKSRIKSSDFPSISSILLDERMENKLVNSKLRSELSGLKIKLKMLSSLMVIFNIIIPIVLIYYFNN